MSRIIKSVAVVEAKTPLQRTSAGHDDLSASGQYLAVIKSHTLAGQPGGGHAVPVDKQGWQAELNRIRVEVNGAKAQLRSLERDMEEEKKRLEEARKRRKTLEDLQGLDVGEHVKTMLAEAETEAKAILHAAREQAQGMTDLMSSQGYQEGLERGTTQARQQFRNEQEGTIRRLSELMESLSGLNERMVREHETEIIQLTLSIAEKVIGKALADDPGLIVEMLRQTVEDNRREEYIKIVISSDLMPVEAKVSEQVKAAILNLGEQIDIHVDPEAPEKSAVVETPKGYTDLNVSGQLENIREAMLEES